MKRNRKIAAIILILCLLSVLFVLPAEAETRTGKVGEKVWFSFDESTGILTVSGKGPMWEDFGWGSGRGESPMSCLPGVVEVRVEEGVTTITSGAFSSCRNLKKVSLPSTLTTILGSAFSSDESLESVVIPNGVTHVGDYCFHLCRKLKTVVLPSSLVSFEHHIFTDCPALESVSFGGENEHFRFVDGVLFSRDLEKLVYYPVYGTDETYAVPDTTEEIGDRAFEGTKLKKITLPEGLKKIGDKAFEDSCLKSITLPDGIEEIGLEAFSGTALEEFVFPGTLKRLPDQLFCWCESLEKVVVSEGVETIGSGAFILCSSLRDITLPGSLKKIEENAFADCTSLESVVIPNGVTEIGDDCFNRCDSMKSIVLPSSLEEFNHNMLRGCAPLESLTFGGENERFVFVDGVLFSRDLDRLLDYPSTLTEDVYTVPETAKEIASGAFAGANVKMIVLPDGLLKIGDGAFKCSKIEEFDFPGSITEIPADVFLYCSYLKKVTVSEGVETIGANAFNMCLALEEISLPESLRKIGEGAFTSCGLKNITLPDGLREIGDGAFSYSSIRALTLPAGITNIGPETFKGCVSLRKAVAEGVGTVGDSAFESCHFLTDLTLGKTLGSVGKNAFRNCAELRFIKLSGDPRPHFLDVPDGEYYSDAVVWAAENEITAGVGSALFAPDDGCERGQVVAFLWRAQGSPAPKSAKHPFVDMIPPYVQDAVIWAVENGVTVGTTPTTFSSGKTCTRGQIVAFLWRAAGKPEPKNGVCPFTDVKKTDYFRDAVLWAVENGITVGTGAKTFSPDEICTRAQIVTFLYRSSAN
ncbi:MAG: leucine-rich repeat protein [Clostridia bacterium]|nr:leucine-rich repeat protein [Clostridia bacterium]